MWEEAIHMVIIIRINHHRHEVTCIVHHNTVTVSRVLPYPIPLTERQIREIIQPIHEQTARPTTDILFQGIKRLTGLVDGHRTFYLLVDGKVTAIELQTTEPVLNTEPFVDFVQVRHLCRLHHRRYQQRVKSLTKKLLTQLVIKHSFILDTEVTLTERTRVHPNNIRLFWSSTVCRHSSIDCPA